MVNVATPILVLFLGTGLIPASAQPDLPPPPPGEFEPGSRPPDSEKGRREGFRNPGIGRPAKPFLMAGAPQFAQMLKIALLPPERVDEAIQKWPKFQEMDETARQEFRRNLERFRQRIREDALQEARNQRIAIPAGREDEFIRFYWDKRMQIETRIRRQAEEQLKREMDGIIHELRQRYPQTAGAEQTP